MSTAQTAPPDDVLVASARRGDATALVSLYQRYVAEVYGFAFNNLGNAQDAEDVTAETFVRVVDNIEGYRGDASFRTWLYVIARNQLRDHFRRNGRHPTSELDPAELGEQALVAEAAADEADLAPERPRWTDLGLAVMNQLPENYRRVLSLRILEERSVRETAAALGTSEGNVKVLQHRALKRAAEIARSMGVIDDDH